MSMLGTTPPANATSTATAGSIAPVPSVFVSYTEVDESIAIAVSQALRQAGFKVWVAPSELRAGDDVRRRVTDEIERRDVFVALLSAPAMKSEWVNDEIRAAIAHQIGAQSPRIIPVYLDVDRLYPSLADLKGLHLRRDAGVVAESVVACLSDPDSFAARTRSCEVYLDTLARLPDDVYRSIDRFWLFQESKTESMGREARIHDPLDEALVSVKQASRQRAREQIVAALAVARTADMLLSDDDVQRILGAFDDGELLPAVSDGYARELRRFARRADARLLQLAAFLEDCKSVGVTRDFVVETVEGWLKAEHERSPEGLRRWQAERVVDEAIVTGLLDARSKEQIFGEHQIVDYLENPSYERGPMLRAAGALAKRYLRHMGLEPN
jgi:hypothetical protein